MAMSISDLAANMAVSLPSRVLVSLGIGWISYAHFGTLINTLINRVISDYNSLPVTIYELFTLAGVTDGLGIYLGAFAAKATLYGIKVLGKLE